MRERVGQIDCTGITFSPFQTMPKIHTTNKAQAEIYQKTKLVAIEGDRTLIDKQINMRENMTYKNQTESKVD